MKLVRQVTLEFREGTSDKVYEVDLCEVGPDQFVVNSAGRIENTSFCVGIASRSHF